MDKEMIKKYINILNLIITRETMYPYTPTKGEELDPGMDWDLHNTDFELESLMFKSFIKQLENMDILKISSGSSEDLEVDYFIIFYNSTNIINAKKHKEKLEGLLDFKDYGSLSKITVKSKEAILKDAGRLNLRVDGAICFNDEIIQMRVGLKEICEIFINRPNQLVPWDDIADGASIKSEEIQDTVAKYISELNKILKTFYLRKTIENTKKIGYKFRP